MSGEGLPEEDMVATKSCKNDRSVRQITKKSPAGLFKGHAVGLFVLRWVTRVESGY